MTHREEVQPVVTPPVTPRLTTARTVSALKPRATRYAARDAKINGLELTLHPNGERVWSVRYRVQGQQRRLRLGKYPRIGLAKARERATAELRKVDLGVDPQAERIRATEALVQAKRDSVDALCASYLERHAKVKKRTWRDDLSKINREILPRWKGRAVTSITRRDCRELVQAVADRGAPIFADRIGALLSRLFRFAVDEDVLSLNPAAHLPKVSSGASEPTFPKAYTDTEIRAIWKATEALAPALRAIYRLGLITGQRPGEIAGLEWDELDGTWWTIPARRSKNAREHRVYLTQPVLDALRDVPRTDDRHAFVGYRGKRQFAASNTIVFANVRRREKPRHALRDTVATGLAAAGVPVEDVARVLNHSYGPRVTASYNAYSYDREKRLALLKWAGLLDRILKGKARGTVVSIRGGTR